MAHHIRPIIGMEVHVQLGTRTKFFCGCPLDFAGEPNSRVCAVCGGLPGALPVLNRGAVEYSLRCALALQCNISRFTKWDRKSYFYPDLPKNYQTSQYDLPIGLAGRFEFSATGSVRIRRAHLEEDAGKNFHEGLDHTRVDLNRAGTPLLEIVTEPDIASADDAQAFCVELQRLVRHLGISAADMQKGQMRFEPNVNLTITHEGREYRTPISEVKNLNSFRHVHDAVAYEIRRQTRAWEADHDYTLDNKGKANYGWDDARGVTEFQRGKEEAHDYRYFPDPDLVPVIVDAAWLETVRADICELPAVRQARYIRDHALSSDDAETILSDRATADLFDAAITAGADARTLARQMISFWASHANARGVTIAALGVSAEHIAELSRLVADGAINATTAANVVAKMLDSERTAGDIVAADGLAQVRDSGAMEKWVDEALAANPKAITDAKTNSKKMQGAISFLRGQVMKLSQGKADPKLVGELLERKLAE